MVAFPHLGFFNSKFLTVTAVKRPILHQRAKFCEDRLSFRRDRAILRFSNTAATTFLDFRKKIVILTVGQLYRVAQ